MAVSRTSEEYELQALSGLLSYLKRRQTDAYDHPPAEDARRAVPNLHAKSSLCGFRSEADRKYKAQETTQSPTTSPGTGSICSVQSCGEYSPI